MLLTQFQPHAKRKEKAQRKDERNHTSYVYLNLPTSNNSSDH